MNFFWWSGARLLRLLLLPGGIIPSGFSVMFSFALRGYVPTHLAIPARQLSIPCVVPWCHCIVLVLSGPTLPSNPPPRVEGLIRTTPYSTPNTGGSIAGERVREWERDRDRERARESEWVREEREGERKRERAIEIHNIRKIDIFRNSQINK